MYKLVFHLSILIVFSINCTAQENVTFPSIDKNDLSDASFQLPKTYNGAALFGYIDGGAELYLEYGFSCVWVTEIGCMGGKFKTSIFRMNGSEEAFGIFSISRFRCKSMPPISFYTCQTPYHLQICKGPFYISIINSTGSKTDSIASCRIGEAIVSKISEPDVDLSVYLPGIKQDIINNSVTFVKGKLGLVNGAPLWEDYFSGVTGFSAVILTENKKTILSVKFNKQDNLAKFLLLHKWKVEDINENPEKMDSGEIVRKLGEYHLLIEVLQ
jgi:hypothetical protein